MEQRQSFKFHQNFASYRKTALPNVPVPSYTEWLRDTNSTFSSEPPLSPAAYSEPTTATATARLQHQSLQQQYRCTHRVFSDSTDTTQSRCDKQKKKCESWGKQQTAILANTWKDDFITFLILTHLMQNITCKIKGTLMQI